jgi:hypothetical protein
LMGVCENTLRDWDIEGKFKAARTLGNHRRYSLTAIREYLDQHPVTIESKSSAQNESDARVSHWTEQGYLENCSKQDAVVLATLLQNAYEFNQVDMSGILSSNQILWLVSEGWKRSQLRKMVSVQPLNGPCGLAFHCGYKNGNMCIESTPVAAVTQKYQFTVFSDAAFNDIKNSYVNAMAMDIDHLILTKLYTTKRCSVEAILDAAAQSMPLNMYEYIAAPEGTIEVLSKNSVYKDIDLISIPTVLDNESFVPMTIAGRYPLSLFEQPIFMPYNLWTLTPILYTGVAIPMLRFGWYTGADCKVMAVPTPQ